LTLLEKLQAHKGGLVRLKSDLYWCSGRHLDGAPGRICLLLGAAATATQALSLFADATAASAAPPGRRQRRDRRSAATEAAAHLLVDGSPHWVWVVAEDVELIDETR